MILQIFAIRDRQLNAYMQPFFAPTAGAATRSFRDIVNEQGHALNKHPEDYELWHLGEYDDNNGHITNGELKQIALAINLIEKGN